MNNNINICLSDVPNLLKIDDYVDIEVQHIKMSNNKDTGKYAIFVNNDNKTDVFGLLSENYYLTNTKKLFEYLTDEFNKNNLIISTDKSVQTEYNKGIIKVIFYFKDEKTIKITDELNQHIINLFTDYYNIKYTRTDIGIQGYIINSYDGKVRLTIGTNLHFKIVDTIIDDIDFDIRSLTYQSRIEGKHHTLPSLSFENKDSNILELINKMKNINIKNYEKELSKMNIVKKVNNKILKFISERDNSLLSYALLMYSQIDLNQSLIFDNIIIDILNKGV